MCERESGRERHQRRLGLSLMVCVDVGIVCGGRGEVFVQHKSTPWKMLGARLARAVKLWASPFRPAGEWHDHLGCDGDGLCSFHMDKFPPWLRLMLAIAARVLIRRRGLIE